MFLNRWQGFGIFHSDGHVQSEGRVRLQPMMADPCPPPKVLCIASSLGYQQVSSKRKDPWLKCKISLGKAG